MSGVIEGEGLQQSKKVISDIASGQLNTSRNCTNSSGVDRDRAGLGGGVRFLTKSRLASRDSRPRGLEHDSRAELTQREAAGSQSEA